MVRDGVVVGVGIFAGNVTGFFRVASTAYLLGTHARADALAVAMGPLDTLNSVIVNTMLVGFVPMLMLVQGAERVALFRQCARIYLSIMTAASVLVAAFAPAVISLVGPGLREEQYVTAVSLLRLMAPSTLLAGASAVYAALLYTERRFVLPALYQACLNGATMAVALPFWSVLGEYGFPLGYVVGAALQCGLTWYASRDLQRGPAQAATLPLLEALRKPGMFLLYAGLLAINIIATRAFATQAGLGMAAAFDYCMRCVSVVVAYLVYPVSNSLLPEIARLRGIGEFGRAYRLIDKGIAWMTGAAVVSAVVGVALRRPVIMLLFQRGSFTSQSTELVSAVFLGLAPALIGWSLLDLISRSFFAMDRPRLPAFAAFVPITVNVMVMAALRASNQLEPARVGWGASAGLMAGFATLFVSIHLRKDRDRTLSPASTPTVIKV